MQPERAEGSSGSRLRAVLLGATALLAGLMLLAWSQQWYAVSLVPESGEADALGVGGDVAAGALAPLALTVLALVAALALAGVGFRVVLGALEALVGGAVIAVAIVSLADPVQASAPAITEATGIGGHESVAALVADVAVSAWPGVAIALGALLVPTGLAIAVTASRWPRSGRRYARVRLAPADGGDADPIAEWDALSEGDDPTAPGR